MWEVIRLEIYTVFDVGRWNQVLHIDIGNVAKSKDDRCVVNKYSGFSALN